MIVAIEGGGGSWLHHEGLLLAAGRRTLPRLTRESSILAGVLGAREALFTPLLTPAIPVAPVFAQVGFARHNVVASPEDLAANARMHVDIERVAPHRGTPCKGLRRARKADTRQDQSDDVIHDLSSLQRANSLRSKMVAELSSFVPTVMFLHQDNQKTRQFAVV